MKALLHPSLEDISLAGLFYALGDDTRLRIIANLHKSPKKPLICIEAVEGIDGLSPSTRSYHFRILREAGIIRSERQGKECYNTLRLDELERKFPGVLKSAIRNFSG